MSVSANPVARGGSFGSGSGILAGRLGGPQFGIVAIGVDVGATNLFRRISAESILAGKQINKFNSTLAVTGSILGGVITTMGVAAVSIAGAAFSVKEFDENIARISAISGKDTAQIMDTIGAAAIELSENLGISAAEISNAAITVVQAGFTLEEAQKLLKPLVEFGAATGGDVQKAAKLGIDAITTFRLEADEAERVFNSLAFTINNAKVDVVSLAQGFNQAASAASQLGASLESTLGVLGALGTAGLAGSPGGTGIKTGLLDLLAPAGGSGQFTQEINVFKSALASTGDIVVAFDTLLRQMGTTIEDFGVSIGESRGEIEDFTTATDAELAVIIDKMSILGDLTKIFGKRAVRSFLALGIVADEALSQTVAMELQFEKVADAAARATDNFSSQLGKLRGQFVGQLLGGDFSEEFNDALKDIVDADAGKQLGAAFNEVITSSLQGMVTNMDDLVEGMTALAESATVFGNIVIGTAPALNTILQIVNAIPDEILRALVAYKLLSKLFGVSIAQTVQLVNLKTQETAIEREQAALAKADMDMAIRQNMLSKLNLTNELAVAEALRNNLPTRGAELKIAQASLTLKQAEIKLQRLELKLAMDTLATKISDGKFKGRDLTIAKARLNVMKQRLALLNAEAPVTAQLLRNEIIRLELASVGNDLHKQKIGTLRAELAMLEAQEASLARQNGLIAAGKGGKAPMTTAGAAAGAVGTIVMTALVIGTLSSLAISLAENTGSVKDNTEAVDEASEKADSRTKAELAGRGDDFIDTSQRTSLIRSVLTPIEDDDTDPRFKQLGVSPTERQDIVGLNTFDFTIEQIQDLHVNAEAAGTALLNINQALEQGFITAEEHSQLSTDIAKQAADQLMLTQDDMAESNIRYIQRSNSTFVNGMRHIGIATINAAKVLGGVVWAIAKSIARTLVAGVTGIASMVVELVGHMLDAIEFGINTMLAGLMAGINGFVKTVNKIFRTDFDTNNTATVNMGGTATLNAAESMRSFATDTSEKIFTGYSDEALLLGKAYKMAAHTAEEEAEMHREVTGNGDKYLIAVRKATNASDILNEQINDFVGSAGDITKIITRIMDASIHTVNGIDNLTSTFFELNNTGIDLAKGMGLFTDFLHLQTKVKIFDELASVFGSLGINVPEQLALVGDALKTQLLAEGLSIADLFSGENFDSNAFIEILAKAMDSPRFEQNNNIVVRISGGNTENNAATADAVLRKLTNEGVPVGPGGT